MRQTVLSGICVSRLVLRNIFWGFCNIFSQTRSTVSSDVLGRPDPFLMHKQPSSLNFLRHVQICIAVGDSFENSLTNACCTVLFDCDTLTHKMHFSSNEGHLYIYKDQNIKFWPVWRHAFKMRWNLNGNSHRYQLVKWHNFIKHPVQLQPEAAVCNLYLLPIIT